MVQTRMERLLRDCKEEGLRLPSNYCIQRGEFVDVKNVFIPETDGIYAAIARAARDLRREPRGMLLDGDQQPSQSLRQRYNGDVLTEMFLSMISPATLHTAMSSRITRFESGVVMGIGGCPVAEKDFGLVFQQMQQPGIPLAPRLPAIGYELITSHGRVVGVGKGYGEPSVLALESVAVNDRTFPAGTLMRADQASNHGRSLKLNGTKLTYDTTSAIPAKKLTHVGPIRLTAFGIDPAERMPDFAEPLDLAQPPARELVHDATIQDLQAIAQAALRAM